MFHRVGDPLAPPEGRLSIDLLEAWATYNGAAFRWELPAVAVMAFAACANLSVDQARALLERRGWEAAPEVDMMIRTRGF